MTQARQKELYNDIDANLLSSNEISNWHQMQWREKQTAIYQNFPSAPPLFPGAPRRPNLPKAPYKGAPEWQCSVYYYWWEYLRRHEGYRQTCLNGGKGEYAELFEHFGDVHSVDFATWWWDHLLLFSFVSDVTFARKYGRIYSEGEGILCHIGYSRSRTVMVNAVREAIVNLHPRFIEEQVRQMYRFSPIGRPRLKSLHEHLLVWDARKLYPDADDAEIADLAGLTGLDRHTKKQLDAMRVRGEYIHDLVRENWRAKQLVVQRHLRIAGQYIENVGKGKFPLRSTR
jgi:hypothetical protein